MENMLLIISPLEGSRRGSVEKLNLLSSRGWSGAGLDSGALGARNLLTGTCSLYLESLLQQGSGSFSEGCLAERTLVSEDKRDCKLVMHMFVGLRV